ncbi:MAG: serine/threonine protein kinase [Planctomycetaceae bacterium]|nr:serine/threonine protein kinase [Planctomycetaceae bacterium]
MASSQSPIDHDDGSRYEPPELPPEVLQPCNEICNDFEEAWNRGEVTPVESLKELLENQPNDERSWLLHNLLLVEFEFRLEELGNRLPDEYEKHFPDDRPNVRKAAHKITTDINAASVTETSPLKSSESELDDTRVYCPQCEGEISAHCPERDIGTCSGCGSTFDIAPSPFEQRKLITLPQEFGSGQRYRLVKYLGCGAFGSVYKAFDCELQTTVALKVAHKYHLFSNEENYQRFRREARAAADLDHPHIVPVRDIVDDRHVLFLVCKFIDGSSLSELLKTEPPADFDEIAQLIRQLALALNYAHGNTEEDRKGIIHRDVKPANILVDSNGGAFLTDFGLARPAIDDEALESLTADGHFMGTPAYASPEHYLSQKSVDGRSDLFSLGIVLYELLTGERPFQGDLPAIQSQILAETPVPPPHSRKPDSHIPRDLETICLKCLEKSPEKRYQTAGELAEDLERFLKREPIRARRVSPVERWFRWGRKNPSKIALGIALIFSGFLITYIHQMNKSIEEEIEKQKLITLKIIWEDADEANRQYMDFLERDPNQGLFNLKPQEADDLSVDPQESLILLWEDHSSELRNYLKDDSDKVQLKTLEIMRLLIFIDDPAMQQIESLTNNTSDSPEDLEVKKTAAFNLDEIRKLKSEAFERNEAAND